jgi:S-methylmethionine-dependent homocysteine/selenocysteine methylase/SAM-dependent methyltransferase
LPGAAAAAVIDRMLMETTLGRLAYDGISGALAAQRCVILDGVAASEHADPLGLHRRYVHAGCDVITTHTRGLFSSPTRGDGGEPMHWMDAARRSLRLARQAIVEQGREGEVAVAFAIDADVDGPDAAETIRLLSRAFGSEPPDLLLFEGLSVLGPTLFATVEALVAVGLPVWLSFARCRHGLCGVHGQHWGGPEGDAFGRAARRFEELGVDALLVGAIPPDHVDGMVTYLRDFTDLPLGVHPNLGYPTSNGWHGDADYARLALRWRDEGAQLIGGGGGVGPEHMAMASAALAGSRPGARHEEPAARADEPELDRATPPEPWRDDAGRSLYPLAFPDLLTHGGVFVPTQGSFLVWRHLFNEHVGHGKRCLDVGCGSGLQTIQLALNGAEHVHGIDIDTDAAEATVVNAFRNGVADRVSAAAVDLYKWVPERRYDVIVASLFQAPVNPLEAATSHHPADFWGRNAVDHLIGLLPRALADDGVAYVLQVSILSQRRTVEVLERHGLRARVADFGFYPFTGSFRRLADQVARVEQMSDAHHLEIVGTDVIVAYLLEITRA